MILGFHDLEEHNNKHEYYDITSYIHWNSESESPFWMFEIVLFSKWYQPLNSATYKQYINNPQMLWVDP
jgi:hypothetical protein